MNTPLPPATQRRHADQDDIRALGALVATMLALAPPSPGNALLDQLRQIAERSQRKGNHGYPSMHDLLLDLQPAAPSPPKSPAAPQPPSTSMP